MVAVGATAGLESQAARGETFPATPTTKKKSRHNRDAHVLWSEQMPPSEERGLLRTEREDAATTGSGSSNSIHPARQQHCHHVRVRGSSALRSENFGTEPQQHQRSRSISRGTGSASSTKGSGSTSSSVYRRLSSTTKRESVPCVPESPASVSVARQSLTSSASTLRPSKQRLEQSRLLSRAHIECRAQLDRGGNNNSSNNNDDDDHEDASANNSINASVSDQPEMHTGINLGAEHWLYEKGSTGASRCIPVAATLPSRARRYRSTNEESNVISPSNGVQDEPGVGESTLSVRREHKSSTRATTHMTASSGAPLHSDRPPSRQRHAFPTHLIDTNGFLAPPSTNTATMTKGKANSHASREKSVRSATASIPIPDGSVSERPPSRYMTKAKRNPADLANGVGSASENGSPLSAQDSPDSASDRIDSNRLPSRRCIDGVYSLNQVNHDPKTDGFADVDESVPPPFRIEITTDSHYSAAAESKHVSPSVSTSSSITRNLDHSRHDRSSLQSRRWSSFGNQEQLHQQMTASQNGDDRCCNSFSETISGGELNPRGRNKPIEWFGQDDQINNAHLFETVVSMSSPRFDHDFDAIGDHSPTSSTSEASPLEIADLAPPRRGTDRSASRGPSILVVPPSSRLQKQGKKQISDQQWILASNNPFFFNAPDHLTASEFDDMDPETAIEQTPLYSPEDLTTIATEMSDLHLDDFIMGELQPMPLSIALGAGSSSAAIIGVQPASAELRTSLGKDFLSLFAQH